MQLRQFINLKPKTASKIPSDLTVQILLSGEINAGKSSLINAWLGFPHLPVGLSRHTAAIHVCHYGPVEKFKIHFWTDQPTAEGPLAKGALDPYLNEGGANVQLVEIEHPAIPEGVEIIDTPGINDTDPKRNSLVRAWMAGADALVFLFDITRAGTATELGFLGEYLTKFRLNRCLFVGNKIDIYPGDRKEAENIFQSLIKAHVSEQISSAQVLLTSTKDVKGPSEILRAILSIARDRANMIRDREVRKELLTLDQKRASVKTELSKRGDQKQMIRQLRPALHFKAKTLLASRREIVLKKDDLFAKVKAALSHELAEVSQGLLEFSHSRLKVQMPVYGEEFQALGDNALATALDRVKNLITEEISRSPGMLLAAMPEISGIATQGLNASHLAQQSASRDCIEAESISQATQLGGAALIGHFLGPVFSVGLIAYSIYRQNKAHEQTMIGAAESVRSELESAISERLSNVHNQVMESFKGWYASQEALVEEMTERFFAELYAATADASEATATELERELKKVDGEIRSLRRELAA